MGSMNFFFFFFLEISMNLFRGEFLLSRFFVFKICQFTILIPLNNEK